ncbi:MAG: class I SAM-dependent methyltransferase [Anaerolineales bacterium]
MTDLEKAAELGQPSLVWRAGQERRLQMILRAADGRERGAVLDNGCGVGAYLERLAPLAERAVGLEIDMDRAVEALSHKLEILSSRGELLPFPNSSFDLLLSHEVIEHMDDDRLAVEEMVRTLRLPSAEHPAGRLALFVPNRGYPFETHGIYWRGKYRFGNFPLVNYLPGSIRDRLAPHVRAYTGRDLERLFADLPVRVVHRTVIFGAYDNFIARWPTFGRLLRFKLHLLERTPLRVFGLSHFWVLERTAKD